MEKIVDYNAYNDPEYNRDIRFWDSNDVQSFVEARIRIKSGGTDGDSPEPHKDIYQYFATIDFDYSYGYIRAYSGTINEYYKTIDFEELSTNQLGALKGIVFFEQSQYASGIRKEAPDEIKNASVFKEVLESAADAQKIPAVIQAGGVVSINAKEYINNGVEQPGVKHITKDSRAGNTSVQGRASAVFFDLNRQLPPDLQQKQVNPLSLPGFVLPQGENGLFRLSGQAATSAATRAVQGEAQVSMLNARAVTVASGQNAQGPGAAAVSAWNIAQAQVAANVASDIGAINLPGTQSLPSSVQPSVSHKYLIETNPELTNLKQFLGSDYMLGKLGYSSDNTQKRLGDGLYEQRLIREAVVARTGQRFLAGLTSDEAMFRYLMDNAVASKQALNLSVGISLTAEQVAALTYDIVWMEEHEVAGEKVLVPVLYLAQAEGRLAANGALIQGRDVTLISGGELNSQGILRATDTLTATAKNISNSGLLQSGERLNLLATDSIRNAEGGIIAGRDVSLIALTGDVINERSVTRQEASIGLQREVHDFVDSAARVEAVNSLSIIAGRDVANVGGVLESQGGLSVTAGRDFTLASVEERRLQAYGNRYLNERVSQHAATATAVGDVSINAGRDLTAIASRIQTNADVALDAKGDVLIASAANESHFLSKSKKVTRQTDQVRQQASVIEAGGDVSIKAGDDLLLSASQIKAGDEAYLYAGNDLALLAAEDYDYSLYQKKSKGSWGRKSFKRNESTQVTQVGSEITTGGDLALVSKGDQLYQKARLESGDDLTLDSGGEIDFEGVKDLKQESREKSKNSWAWTSAKGKGKTDETLQQSQLIAQGDIVIKAVEGLKIDIKQVNQQTISQTINAMVQADPSLAWMKEAEQRGDVDWRRVKEVHDSFKYSHSGLGGPASMIIAIAVAYFTAGALSGLVANGATAAGASTAATSASGAWAAGTGASLSGVGWANAVVTAGLTGMTSNAAVSTINNRGNLGAVIKDITSEDALRGYAVAGITAGLTNGLYDGWVGTETGAAGAIQNGGNVLANGGLSTLDGIGRFAGNQLLQNGTSTVLDRALGGDSSFSDALRSSLANTFAAAGFNWIGDVTAKEQWNLADGSPGKVAMHAVMGGLAAEAAGGDFKTGALAAGVNELLVDTLAKQYGEMDPDQKKSLLVMNSQVIGVLAATAQGGDEKALQVGAQVAGTATNYNYTVHTANAQKAVNDAIKECASRPACSSQFGEVSAEALNDAIKALASNDIDQVRAQDLAAVQMAAFILSDHAMHEAILIPETGKEQLIAGVKTGVEVADTVTAVLGAGGLIKSVIKSPGLIKSIFNKGDDLAAVGPKAAGEAVSIGGRTCVYSCVVEGVTRYVGITDDIVKRGQAHLREKGIVITKVRGLEGLSRADARAVEQTLIDFHGLGKDGGTLINKINSISKIKNPTKYEQGLIRGAELLKKAGYEGF